MNQHQNRKDDHLQLANNLYTNTNAFNELRIIHNSLPELAFSEIDLSNNCFQQEFEYPFYIEAMTGGSNKTNKINEQLIKVAKETNLPIALGSSSIALKDREQAKVLQQLRSEYKNGFIIANLGANCSAKDAQYIVNLLQANALEIHINALQEILMPEGDRDLKWINNIQQIVQTVSVPVIVKEIGTGMSKQTIQKLINIGANYINISGKGGTNFAKIENNRSNEPASYLNNWGQTTIESLLEAKQIDSNHHQISIIASGGVKNPLDIIKCLILNAKLVGIAGTFLNILLTSGTEQLIKTINTWKIELKKIMLLLGAKDIDQLQNVDYILSSNLLNYCKQRNIKI